MMGEDQGVVVIMSQRHELLLNAQTISLDTCAIAMLLKWT